MHCTALRALTLAIISGYGAAQNTWYVSELATSPFEGTLTQPFKEISQAIADPDTLSGDTLLVLPGKYESFSTGLKGVHIRSTDGPLVTSITPGADFRTVRLFAMSGNDFEGFTVYGKAGGWAVTGRSANVSRCILLGQPNAEFGFLQDANCGVNDSTVKHCLVAGFKYGVSSNVYCIVVASNSILHGNTHDLDTESHYCVFGSVGFLGLPVNCLQVNPQVVDFAGHDFHLLPNSPCIDAGDPNSPLDPDGSRADIGPFPYDANYLPYTTYCTAKVNSLGCTPQIQATNTGSLTSSRPFWLSCTNQISQRSGLLSYGFAPLAAPYQGGFKCVAAPTRRSGVLNSGGNSGAPDCSGVFTLDFNQTIRAGLDPELVLGQEVFCQFWARDATASFGSNRSDALRFTVAP
ncbi:MAG: hypothetical protein IT454_19775 [Planctomycetes bacterium]|nr:hypothetical protein [Planctomycetota bacterium]